MIIVSCCNQSGGIFTIDEETFEVTKVINVETRGIDIYDGKLFACNFQGLQTYDENFDLIKEYTKPKDWHGLRVHNDKIYVISAKHDSISIFDTRLNIISGFGLRVPLAENKNRNHINDIFFDDNGDFYYSMFSGIARQDYQNGNGCIKKVGDRIIKTICSNLKEPHTPYVYERELYYCNSELGEFRKENEIILKTDTYVRGITITKNYYWIGCSKYRHDLNRGRCGVIRKHRVKGEEVFIPLPANEVYGITRR
jgi:hypothetical protein